MSELIQGHEMSWDGGHLSLGSSVTEFFLKWPSRARGLDNSDPSLSLCLLQELGLGLQPEQGWGRL